TPPHTATSTRPGASTSTSAHSSNSFSSFPTASASDRSHRSTTTRRRRRADQSGAAMEAVKSLLKPKPTPQQQLREWQRRLRNKGRNIERQIRDVQKEEKKVEKAIRDAAKRGDMGSAEALAKELVQSRKAVNRLYENKAQLNSISMHLGEIVGNGRSLPHIADLN
uniref:Uncharacterized protein n=1 Tax=Aegilops tauschii subsp. strangulata TaxID=200361 RepID=A0A453MW57_AEGTS